MQSRTACVTASGGEANRVVAARGSSRKSPANSLIHQTTTVALVVQDSNCLHAYVQVRTKVPMYVLQFTPLLSPPLPLSLSRVLRTSFTRLSPCRSSSSTQQGRPALKCTMDASHQTCSVSSCPSTAPHPQSLI